MTLYRRHAFKQYHHGGYMDPPDDHWEYWGCRCGVTYRIPRAGYATRAEARRQHREHLAMDSTALKGETQ